VDLQPFRGVASRGGLRNGRDVQGRLVLALAAAAALAALPRPARADESAISGAVGWAGFTLPGEDDMDVSSFLGGQLAFEYEHAFGEALSVRVEAAGAVFHHEDGTGWLALGDAGLVYRFDVLKYVPYVFGGVGVVTVGGGPLPSTTDPVLVLGGGVDVLKSREWSWGGEVRLASFAGDVTTISVGVRITRRWGFF
jgi:hypothetical protein